ncbi:hypothetical protein U3A58_04195 [Algoriphagus sp. C2-6-M1]|uniref:hypothetical protein n=1 Tax=Algoriphagus persicinus TaxID=3108754 RepID=UPI002B3B83C1|nr:hypothetical protein [Algoriphagus sp. C2-6-M1]MEB2779584.1 hypothetical protein [Algoriphagus sp. C2-6-M1]
MKSILLTYLRLFTFIVAGSSYGQTYTYNPTKTNCTSSWTDGNCWDKVNISGCSNNSTSLYPPLASAGSLPSLNSYKDNCQVNVNINHNLLINPDFDFAFLGSNYRIYLGDNVSLSTWRNLYLLERATVRFLKSTGTSNALVNLINIFYSKQAQFYVEDRVEVESYNIIYPTNSQYEGILFHISPLGVLKVIETLAFVNGNSNKIIVEGLFIVSNLILDAGNPGFTASDINLKNALLIKGAGRSNVCSGISIAGDSYVAVEANGSLNIESFNLSGSTLFENWGNINTNSVNISGEPRFRLFSDSQFANQYFNVNSGEPQYFKCGTQVASISTDLSGCTAAYTVITDQNYWDSSTGDWCFRILPIKVTEEKLVYNKEIPSVILHWTTIKETGNDHFEIERSIQGIADFKKIGEIKSQGFSMDTLSYQFRDNKLPLNGERLYYRIRYLESNELYSFGKVMSVLPIVDLAIETKWFAYPNPNKGKILQVNLGNARLTELIEFRIFSHLFFSQNYQATDETEMNRILTELAGNLPIGLNFLEIRSGNRIEILKVLVEK